MPHLQSTVNGLRLGNVRTLPRLMPKRILDAWRAKPQPAQYAIAAFTGARWGGGLGSIKVISSWNIAVSIRKDSVYAHITINTQVSVHHMYPPVTRIMRPGDPP
jgi:hypothetical protein